MKKYIKYILFIVVGFLFILTFVFLYKKSKPKIVRYQVVQPVRKDIERTTVATGAVEPRDEILIKPQISGIIEEVYKEAGQMIRKDEVIARVKVIPELGQLNSAESRLRTTKINLEQAEKDFKRNQTLYEKGLISKEEYEKACVQIETTREEYQLAIDSHEIVRDGVIQRKADISNTLIRSTIDGLILDVPVKKGNSVILTNNFNEGTTIATVANMDDLIFRGSVDETEVGKIYEGMEVKLTIGALQNVMFNATLEYISPKAQSSNGANLFEIKAAVERPDSVFVRSGYSANATIVLEAVKDVISIPESVLDMQGDSTFVWKETVAGDDQKFERYPVLIGLSNGVDVEVTEGVSLEDKLKGLPIK